MGKQSFIELIFPIKEIIPQSDLGLKFEQLGMSPEYQRLIIDLELLNDDKQSILVLDTILDTGLTIVFVCLLLAITCDNDKNPTAPSQSFNPTTSIRLYLMKI